jgi:ribokinase
MRVAGLGQCSLDYIAVTEGYPGEDTKFEAAEMLVEGGGPVATALVALSRLKVKTDFAGVIADDPAGVEIRRGLKAEGVGIASLVKRRGGGSQTANIIVNKSNATRTVIWRRATVKGLTSSEVRPSFIKGKGFLLLDGLMAPASIRAAGIARRLGVKVMLDGGSLRPGMLKLAAMADYVVCSESFAREYARTPAQALKALASIGVGTATVTLGKGGSLTLSDGVGFKVPSFRVRAVDTTGAGDVFHGGYVYGLLKGWGIKKTVTFASAFAALKCLEVGGRSGIPTLARTLRFMRSKN